MGHRLDGVGFTFGDSCRKHLDHTGRGHLWKSGPNPEPYWDWYKDWGWTGSQFVEFCNEAADCGCLFSGPVRPGYQEAIEAVAKMGHDIVVITDRPFGSSPRVSEAITEAWFLEHDIYYDELIFSADKTCRWTDVFIDDKLDNYDKLHEAGTKVFLLNRPWNQVKGTDARNRIDTIEQYVDAIAQITENGFADLTFS